MQNYCEQDPILDHDIFVRCIISSVSINPPIFLYFSWSICLFSSCYKRRTKILCFCNLITHLTIKSLIFFYQYDISFTYFFFIYIIKWKWKVKSVTLHLPLFSNILMVARQLDGRGFKSYPKILINWKKKKKRRL